jgi:uncharacterized membrane protein
MDNLVKPFAEVSALFVEGIGVVAITGFVLYGLLIVFIELFKRKNVQESIMTARKLIGRGILLGLEFLVAADIIHTVAVELTFKTIGVLTVIVLIRTFLSFTLDVEITGRWPWQQ